MAAPNPKFIGSLGLNQFDNYISAVSAGVANKISTERLIKAAGLEGSSDPFEKIFSAFTTHVENFDVTEEMERKLGAISREYENIEDAPYLVREYAKSVEAGKTFRSAPAIDNATRLAEERIRIT